MISLGEKKQIDAILDGIQTGLLFLFICAFRKTIT